MLILLYVYNLSAIYIYIYFDMYDYKANFVCYFVKINYRRLNEKINYVFIIASSVFFNKWEY